MPKSDHSEAIHKLAVGAASLVTEAEKLGLTEAEVRRIIERKLTEVFRARTVH